jgi:Immunoglobulin-like domain of bacterial spore germination/Sporulation and spore germination
MTGRGILLRFLPIAAVVAVAACGGGGTSTVTGPTTTTQPTPVQTGPATQTTAFRVYLLHAGKLQPVARTAPRTAAVASAALTALIAGPTSDERRLGFSTAMTGIGRWSLLLRNGVLRLKTSTQLDRLPLAQIVYTLTQFPTVSAVELGGKRYTRADFEDETPVILVESPLPLQAVHSPLRATGTANTFEATFDYDLVDPEGKVIAHHFVTATSGSGTRGTFDFTVPFATSHSGPGKLVVYELSAENGQRIHQVEIPIQLER